MIRSKIMHFFGCLILVGTGWAVGDCVQAETLQNNHLIATAQSDAAQSATLKSSNSSGILANLKAEQSTRTLQPDISTPQSKQQRLIEDIKDSPLSSSRLLPDVGAFP